MKKIDPTRRQLRLVQDCLFACIGLAIVLHGGAARAGSAPGPILGTPDQIAKDRLAIQIMASPPVQAGIRKLEAFYAQV